MRNLLHEVLHEVFEKVFNYVYNQSSDEKQNAPKNWITFYYQQKYNSNDLSFCGSITQSNLLRTTNGRIIRPYSLGLNRPLNMSSAVFQIKDERFCFSMSE